jgi:hypothetical protein
MAGKAAKRAAGGFVGGQVPYGKQLRDGQLVPNRDEQQTVQLVTDLRSGGLSLRPIGDELARSPHRHQDRGPWQPTQVSRIPASK